MSVTRLLGKLEIYHLEGKIVFKIRNPNEIKKRGTDTILIIEHTGKIPMLYDGKEIYINSQEIGINVIQNGKEKEENQISQASPPNRNYIERITPPELHQVKEGRDSQGSIDYKWLSKKFYNDLSKKKE